MFNLYKGSNILITSIVLIAIALFIYMATPSGDYKLLNDQPKKLFFADNISRAHRELIKRFNKENEGKIEIVPTHLPFSNFSTNERKELLARTLRSKSNRIDVFAVDLIWVPRFARWSLPLDDYIDENELEKLIEPARKSCYYHDKLYATPFYIDIGLMYYRKDIIQSLSDGKKIEEKLKQSICWEDFINLSKRFEDKTDNFYLFAADNYEGLMCSFVEGLANQHSNPFQDHFIQFDSPEAEKTLQLLVDLVHKYRMTPIQASRFDEFQCYKFALKNNTVFFRGWPGLLTHYQPEEFEVDNFHSLALAALPHFKNGEPAMIFGGWDLMISKFSTKIEEALKFIRFVHREENQKAFFELGGYLPTLEKIYHDSTYLMQKPDLQFCSRLFNFGVHRPYLIDYTKISDELSYYLNAAIEQRLTATEALKRATENINK